MSTANPPPPPPLAESPLYLLAVLHAARKSRDVALEQVTRHKLAALGVRVVFDDEPPTAVPRPEVGSE